MDGLVTGVVNDANKASELSDNLKNAGYDPSVVSMISKDTPASSGPLQGVTIPDVPEKLMAYGNVTDSGNDYYEEINEDYVFLAVPVNQNDVELVKERFASCGAKDIQFIHK